MRSFADLYATAVLHKGGEQALERLLPQCLSAVELAKKSDAELLSTLSLRVFQAGLKHDLVAAKWPAFEQVFQRFDPYYCAMLSDEALELALSNRNLIRHLGKLKSIRHNAQMVREVAAQHGSFGQFLAAWPVTDLVGLWAYLKKYGAQLGGLSGARFLRMAGKDTFVLTDDVVAVLKAEGLVSKVPTSQRDLLLVQEQFNVWHSESGRPMCHISRIVSMNTF